jgi:hypothetical protein
MTREQETYRLQGNPLNEPTARGPVAEDSVTPGLSAKTLDSLLGDSMDQVLDELLGRKAKEAIYDYLERNYLVARDDIPKNIEKFLSLAQEVFGKGSRTIARCIMKRLWEQLGWKFVDVPGFDFSDYLEAARARIAREVLEKARASSLGR